jgi:hypothetical protein
MTLTVTQNGDVPQQPAIYANSYVPDQLIAGPFQQVTVNGTVKSGATVNTLTTLPRGTIMGQITVGSATSAAKAGGNTGTGTLVLDASTPVLANAVTGVYTVRNIEAVVNGGKFQVIDPRGFDLGTVIIPAGAGGSVTFSDRIKFVLTDGGTDFIVGDGFDVTVAAGSLKYVPAVATVTDGSSVPVAVLVDDSNPSAADVVAGLYLTGEFNNAAITFDTSYTVAVLTPLLASRSIFLKSSVSAADPVNE